MKLPLRYLARITIEADTPIAVGAGDDNLVCDKPVLKGINNLPFIPGTSLGGVLRHNFSEIMGDLTDDLFGYQKKRKKEDEHAESMGSRLIFSSAYLLGKEGQIFEELKIPDWNDPFYKEFLNLQLRQHVKINHKGAAEKGAKFDNEIVWKGTRFVFEIELKGTVSDENSWNILLGQLYKSNFRIGSGTRKGFGKISVKEIITKKYDLLTEDGRNQYANKSSSLNSPLNGETFLISEIKNDHLTYYRLELNAEDFFLFSSGFSSDKADINPVIEKIIAWENNKPEFKNHLLIPASSIKGAIAHRTAFHFNKLKGITAEKLKDNDSINELVSKNYYRNLPLKFNSQNHEDRIKLATVYNPAIIDLFGFAADDKFEISLGKNDSHVNKAMGKLLFSDIYIPVSDEKLFNHISIDRFTGGAIDGALFSEIVSYTADPINIEIILLNNASVSVEAIQAFENALNDIADGHLPLGGGTMRGHGCFNGKVFKNNKLLYYD